MTPSTTINPYRVTDSGRGLHACMAEVNRSNFECYGPDVRYGAGPGRIVVDTLHQYERLIRALAAVPHLAFVPHRELSTPACPPDKVLCAIRHDVDADIRAAVAEAEIEHAHGARTTYFVLHTAPYYGVFDDGVFRRNTCMAIAYRRLQALGQEVALHTDPLWIYQDLRIDGAAAVRAELAWLRQEGLDICGTVAHNSAPVYGIENFAIFKGRNRRGLGLDTSGPGEGAPDATLDEIVHDGKWAPLGVLDERELGLTYEGNDLFRQSAVPYEYGATRRVNRWRWNAHMKRLRDHPDPTEDGFIDQDRLLAEVAAMPPGQWLLINVHPLYYGARHAATSAPARRVDRGERGLFSNLGWETYRPHTVVARSGDHAGAQEFQAINVADAHGLLDTGPTDPRVLVLGGINVDGACVAVPEHMSRQVEARLTDACGAPVGVRQLAFPGMGLCRHYAWFQAWLQAWFQAWSERRVDDRRSADGLVVILGLGADELVTSLARYWSVTTGFAAARPPGAYLRATDEGVEVVPGTGGAAIRRAEPRPLDAVPSLADEGAADRFADEIAALQACLSQYADAVRAAGATPLALVNECGESAGLWAPGADDASRRAGHARFLAIARQWADAAGVELVDPYALFLDQPATLPAHWSGTPEWSATGHRLAAGAVFRALAPRLAGPDAAP